MKLKISIGVAILLFVMGGIIFNQYGIIQEERAEKKIYQTNTSILLDSVSTYKANDSLNVASIGVLELKVSEFRKYRQEDASLIEGLRVDLKRMNSVIKAQSQTITNLEGYAKDTIIILPEITASAKCINESTKWYDIDLCIFNDNKYRGTFKNKEELIAVNHIVPKKFLFFKWGVKEVRTDIVSKNPNTKIVNVESSIFRK